MRTLLGRARTHFATNKFEKRTFLFIVSITNISKQTLAMERRIQSISKQTLATERIHSQLTQPPLERYFLINSLLISGKEVK